MVKHFLSLLIFPLAVISLNSCNRNSAKNAAQEYLNHLYKMEYEEAKAMATQETKNLLELREQLATINATDSDRVAASDVTVEIKNVQEQDERATVVYTVSGDPREHKMKMVKKDGKWLADMTKTDAMEEEMMNTASEAIREDTEQ